MGAVQGAGRVNMGDVQNDVGASGKAIRSLGIVSGFYKAAEPERCGTEQSQVEFNADFAAQTIADHKTGGNDRK